MKKLTVKTVVSTGVTAALFFVLMRFARIPTGIPNTDSVPAYGLLAMMAALFGPVCGAFGGLIGHVLADMSSYGVWWSWEIATGILGLIIGLFAKLYKIEGGGFKSKQIIIFNVVQAVANLICWVGVAPALDIAMYGEPADKVWLQGLVAGVGNIVNILILGTILLFAYSKIRGVSTGLKKED
jgi:energy-coupling factor transport system substrate-specific component